MAVISAAVAAVAAAVATTTVATVATAVVAVSTAVGVLGLATTAIGLVTKNEGLLKAGKIMGFVGLAGGALGGAIGGIGAMASGTGSFLEGASAAYSSAAGEISKAWDSGVGSWFSSGTGAEVAGPQGINASAPSTSLGSAPQNPYGVGSSGGMQAPTAPTDMSTALNAPPADVLASQQGNMAASQTNAGISPPIPQAPIPATPAPAAVGTPYTIPAGTQNPLPSYMGNAPSGPAGGFLSNMPDWAKFAGVTTGMQGISGLASGYFAGKSAEEKLNLDKQINDQRQGQVNYMNQNAAYAPLVQFRRGFVQGGA